MENSSKAQLAKSEFDRQLGALAGRNDVVRTKESVIRSTPMWGVGNGTETFIVQTMRAKDEDQVGDFIFIERISEEGTVRIVLPPDVTDVIARQRDAVTTMNRRQGARQAVRTREERGIRPAFLRGRK
jgi:hypothetical protein